MHLILTSAILTAIIHSCPASYAGVWVVTAVDFNGKSTADDKARTEALKEFPTLLTLQKDGRYLRKHLNFYAGENEEWTFAVARVLSGWAEVDVSATLRIRGDGPPRQDVKFEAKEIWRLTGVGTLQRCYRTHTAKGRPSGFKTIEGDGLVVVTYTRVKAPDGKEK